MTSDTIAGTELWLPCVSWDSYSVSNLGRVMRIKPGRGAVVGRIRKPSLVAGYPAISVLNQSGKLMMVYVHRLVVEAFIGPLDDDFETNHKNGVRTDNRLENLELVSHRENMQHAYDTGLHDRVKHRGSRHPRAKLCEDDVMAVRMRLNDGDSPRSLAEKYGVSRSVIYDIRSGDTWGWLE